MQACHNCENKPLPGTQYTKTACASCKLGKEQNDFIPDPNADCESKVKKNDDWLYNGLKCNHPSDVGDGETGMSLRKFKDSVFSAAALLVKKLIDLKEKKPAIYDVVIAKMENPLMSYDAIGEKLYMTKQNVEYSLRKSIQMIPELSYAFIIDTRFCTGAGRIYQDAKRELKEIRREKYGL